MNNQESGREGPGEARARDVAQQAIRKMRLAHKWKSASGRDAWSELNRAAYGDGKGGHPRKLTHDEAAVLARRLHICLVDAQPQLKALGVNKTDLCRKAFKDTDSKELYRITLPPGADPGNRALGLRVSADKYVRFISSLADALNISVDLIAEPLLAGTRLSPLSRTDYEFSELDKIQIALQRIVDDLDREFSLFETYRRTASLKCKGVEKGDKCCWPLDTPYELDGQDFSVEGRHGHAPAFEIAIDPNQAFFRRNQYYGTRTELTDWYLYGFDTGALQDDDFFFVPHAPLGHLVIWDLPDRKKNRAAYARAVDEQVFEIQNANGDPLAIPKDEWDDVEKRPFGQTMRRGGNVALQRHFWLIAYPHPDNKRLVPTLYQPGEEGGAYLLPLDLVGLEMLADAVWVSPTSQLTALEKIQQLLIDIDAKDGLNPISRGLRRTSGWLAANPIVKKEADRQEANRRLDELFRGR